MPCPTVPVRSRAVGAAFLIAALSAIALASCRSPLSADAKRADCTLSFILSGADAPFAAAPSAGSGDSRARLILPSASRLAVTLTPAWAPADAPVSAVVDIASGASSVDVSFAGMLLGSYDVVAEASDATGTVLFRQESAMDLGPAGDPVDLCLVPVATAGSPFTDLESAESVLQSFSAFEARTWTVPAAAFADGTLSLVAERTAGLLLFVQDSRGKLLNSDSSGRSVDCSALAGETVVFVTLYNKSAAAGTVALSLNVPRAPAARWTFEVPSTTDFPESVGGITATANGTSQIVDWYHYRSAGALLLASSQSSYLSLASSIHTDAPPPWTVSAWLQTTDLSQTQALLTGSEGQAILAADSSQRVGVVVGGVPYAFSSSIENYEWTHVTIVNTGYHLKLYVNGVPDGSPIADPAAAAMKLPLSVIGNDASSDFFEGRVDDLRAYRVALSADEVASLLDSYPKALDYSGDDHGSVTASPDLDYYDKGTIITLTAVPNDATWKFDGWSGDASGTAITTTVVMDADKSVQAAFSTAVPRYSVTYDYNGGTFEGGDGMNTGAPTGESGLLSGSVVTVHSAGYRINHPTDPALYFTGWNTRADGNGDTYLPNGALSVGTADVVLYANWEPDDAADYANHTEAATIAQAGSTTGYTQYNGDMDYYKFVATATGTITLSVTGVSPALFTAFISDEDLTGTSGTGWDVGTGDCIVATKSIVLGQTYYVYVGHQSQAYHTGAARVGVYTVTMMFTP